MNEVEAACDHLIYTLFTYTTKLLRVTILGLNVVCFLGKFRLDKFQLGTKVNL